MQPAGYKEEDIQIIQPSDNRFLKVGSLVSRIWIFSVKREMSGGGNGASPGLGHLQLGKLPTFNISELMADNVRAVAMEQLCLENSRGQL